MNGAVEAADLEAVVADGAPRRGGIRPGPGGAGKGGQGDEGPAGGGALDRESRDGPRSPRKVHAVGGGQDGGERDVLVAGGQERRRRHDSQEPGRPGSHEAFSIPRFCIL